MTDTAKAIDILERLVGFDTTSRLSNLQLVEWVEDYLRGHDVASERVANADGTKANLFASLGPAVEGGVILSGHSDVVPVDGQDWSSDPWTLTPRDGRLYGRGTCDMKGFIALALAHVPAFAAGKRPVHLAISYDEEIGCKGAPDMIARMAETIPTPRAAIIGEPSLMRVIDGHKGITVHEVSIRGHAAHSSLPQIGVSANHIAIELMAKLREIARDLAANPRANCEFSPPYSTLTIGMMHGGTAANILAGSADFTFDLRCLPGDDPATILQPFFALCDTLRADIRSAFPATDIAVSKRSSAPPLTPDGNGDAAAFVRSLTGENGPASKVSFAAEAGQFCEAGFPTVICGPGSIEQAHQPDEWIALDQMEAGNAFMVRLAEELAR
ncbi:acetylornithine deacetylase [Paraurantiacibacter namhicola]|uniref:acetylornithine deacetylase n=1 Tax=Paraurantiacibacter namhicola TaxID=645517 RepID=UPI00082D2DDC|nr:acetylornithine deacetylase [Paraurantiacibacter namhicola]